MSPSTTFLDPAALMRIKSLELRAKVVVEGLWKGMHRSPYHGFSVEFSEYRAYVQGDDPRYIDWKVLARSDRTYIKKFEDETNLRCQLVIDHSKSMKYGSQSFTKADYAATLAATLASFLMKQGDAAGLTTFADGIEEHLPPRNRPGHLRRIITELERPAKAAGTSLDLSVGQLADLLRKRGMICLITDLLAPIEHLEKQLALLGAMGHDLVLFHLMDRAEIDFTFEKSAHFRDAETGTERFIDPQIARETYLKRLQAHRDTIQAATDRHNVEYHFCPTDQPLEEVLFDFLSARQRKKASKSSAPRAAERNEKLKRDMSSASPFFSSFLFVSKRRRRIRIIVIFMNWLFPLYLAGAAAIIAPILLHLRRRPPQDRVEFSSLLFLDAQTPVPVSKRRLENWLLLLLRCLALILLALMFSRPFIQSESTAAASPNSATLILLDRSASMRRADLWKQAIAEAEKQLKAAKLTDRIALAVFDRELTTAVEFRRRSQHTRESPHSHPNTSRCPHAHLERHTARPRSHRRGAEF
jgi:uncharacterized protein (DUF58 family)